MRQREFLQRFNKSQKTRFANRVTELLREGMTSPDKIINMIPDEEFKGVIKTYIDKELFKRYIAYHVNRLNNTHIIVLPPYLKEQMKGRSVTQKQLEYLLKLKYNGPYPKDRYEASVIIEELENSNIDAINSDKIVANFVNKCCEY